MTLPNTDWREVAKELGDELRVIRPTLPLGAHRTPMRHDADLSLRGKKVPQPRSAGTADAL